MHEFAIARSICDIALDEARRHDAREVISITCRVGVLRRVVPELMDAAFELSAEGTLLEGARLKIEVDGIEVTCGECGSAQKVEEIPFACPACGSAAIKFAGGQDIFMTSMEISQGADDGDSGTAAARRAEPGERG